MTVGWGFIGAGWIASQAVAPAVHASASARLHAVASRDQARAAALQPVVVHATYADLLDDPDVEVVYVCLANHLHAPWVLRSLQAGKHVLCEKPLALDTLEAHLLVMAAADADRLLVEAAWTRWHPRVRRLVALARSGDLGSLASIASAFTFTADLAGNYRSDPAMGGGALLDVGGYQAHCWVAVTDGAPPLRISSVERSLAASGVDLTTRVTGLLGDIHVDALASFERDEHQSLVVRGTAATATMLGEQAFTSWRQSTALRVGDHVEEFGAVDAYRLMVDSVSQRVQGDDAWVVPLADSERVAAILDAVADSC